MERNPAYMYRVVVRPALYPKDQRWSVNTYYGAELKHLASYTDEALPEWIRKDVALLNMVHNQDAIPSIGHRVGDAYWLQPKDKNESCTGV